MNTKKLSFTTIWWICNVNVWGWIPQELAQFGIFWPLNNQKYSQNFGISKKQERASL